MACSPIWAEPALGTWISPPDPKGQTGHLEIVQCGDRLCGTLVRAFDIAGMPVTTPNIGKQLLRDMARDADGTYSGGAVFVPLMKAEFPANMTLLGDKLEVRGCAKPGLCKKQVWTRVR